METDTVVAHRVKYTFGSCRHIKAGVCVLIPQRVQTQEPILKRGLFLPQLLCPCPTHRLLSDRHSVLKFYEILLPTSLGLTE